MIYMYDPLFALSAATSFKCIKLKDQYFIPKKKGKRRDDFVGEVGSIKPTSNKMHITRLDQQDTLTMY